MNIKRNELIRAFSYRSKPTNTHASQISPYPLVAEVVFGLYEKDGRVYEGYREMSVCWYGLPITPIPLLQIPNNSWQLLADLSDVMMKITNLTSQEVSPDKFCEFLVSCGFTDITN
jgi:hypothetical protein